MFRRIVAVVCLVLPALPVLRADETQERAIRALQERGAVMVRDTQRPGQPIISVDLNYTEAGDKDLELLKAFPELRTLKLSECLGITEKGMRCLAGLTHLQELDLDLTRLSDDGLKHLEKLTDLRYLVLSRNEITDEGVRCLRRLTHLRRLDLSLSKVTDKGLAYLQDLADLQELDLSCTKIKGEGLTSLKKLNHLETLLLYSTDVEDETLAHLEQLVNLRSLDLSHTNVSDKGLEHLKKLTALRHLDLDAQKIFGGTLQDLKYLQNLRSLKLGANVIHGENLAKLKELKSLRELSIFSARFEDDDWKHIGRLINLESLRIGQAKFVTDKGLEHLWRLSQLRELELRFMSEMTDKSLERLGGLTNLRRLHLAFIENVSNVGLRNLRRLNNLEALEIRALPINEGGLEILKELKHLQTLSLTNSRASDETLKSLRGLRSLRELQISGTKISDAGLLYLKDLPELQVLDLSSTHITNRGLGHLKAMPNLRTIKVEESKVTNDGVASFRAARPETKVIQYTVTSTVYAPPSAIDEKTPPPALLHLVRILSSSDDLAVQLDVLRGMHDALQGRRSVAAPEGWSEVYRMFADSKNREIREKVLQLSVLFGDPQALAALRRTAVDTKAEVTARRTALQTLIEKRPPDLLPLLQKLIGDRAVRGTVLRGLASYSNPQTPHLILDHYAAFSDTEKSDAIATLASRPAYALALLDAMEKDRVPRRDLSAFTVRQLLAFKDKALTERLTKVWGTVRPPAADKAALLTKYKAMVPPSALKKADRKQGRLLFSRTCASCHTLFGEGGKIGPDLTGSQRTNPEYLLTKLLDPSAVVARDYLMTVLTLKNGRVLSGLIKEENDKTLTLQTQNEAVRLDKSDIEERQRSQQSMMPDGLLAPLSSAEVRDLIAYVSGAGQVPLPR